MGTVKDLITTFVGDRFIELLNSGTDRIADGLEHAATNKIVEYLCSEYERNKRTKTLLHRNTPIELDSFYQPLSLKEKKDNWIKKEHSIKRIKTDRIETLFNVGNCISIIGIAGSGKSTLVKYLLVNSIESNYKIPIKIELRYLNDYEGNLLSYITDEIIKFSRIAERDTIIERMMQSGDFVFFFDGYDEISSSKKEILANDIVRVTKKYNSNKYILTSRPFANVEMLDNFYNYEVCELSSEEIESFVRKQFGEDEGENELVNRIIGTIRNDEKEAYKSFLSNPLLLSMFIITYQADSNIPQKRSDYYSQVFNTLYSIHDTQSKLGYERERKAGLSKEQYLDILSRFSYKTYFSYMYSFSETIFCLVINRIKKNRKLTFQTDDLLYDFKVAFGILTQDGLDLTFPHRSLQEYFAASYIAALSVTNKQIFFDGLLSEYDAKYKSLNKLLMELNSRVNFLSLLKEMDRVDFQRFFVMPMLERFEREMPAFVRDNVRDETEVFSTFSYFCSFSNMVDSRMSKLFNNHFNELNKAIDSRDYIKEFIIKNNLAGSRHIFSDYLLPFLQGFNFSQIKEKVKKEIEEAERQDADFLDGGLY